MILEEIRSVDGTGTLAYLLVDETARESVLIDPNIADLDELTSRIDRSGSSLRWIIDTHTHADHVSAAGELHKKFAAPVVMHENTVNKWKTVDQGDRFGIGDTLRANASIEVQRYVTHGETIRVGSLMMTMLHTPGHTDNHISPLVDGHVFTGDLLLLGQAGRTDLPGGEARQQYDSLFDTILTLPDSTWIHPGHDYEGNSSRTIGQEKLSNPFLVPRSKEEYLQFVAEFFPPLPEYNASGGATLQCGVQRVRAPGSKVKEITPEELSGKMSENHSLFLLDVREPYELIAFGALPGVVNIPLGELKRRIREVPDNREIVVVCQSGSRSAEAANILSQSGFRDVYNLLGGTSRWARSGYRISHPSLPAQIHPQGR